MRSQRGLHLVFSLVLSLFLGGCGPSGGKTLDGSEPAPPGTPGGPVAARVTLLASSSQLSSSASDAANGVTLTAIVRDANQNPIAGAPVQFATSDSALITPPSPSVTNDNGQIQAVVTTGGDPQNRVINISATSGSVSALISVSVVGTTLTVTGPPSAQINVPTQYTASLVDSGGVGIPNQVVDISTNAGNTLSASTLTTDAAGGVTFTLRATVSNSFVTVSSLGLTATQSVAVATDSFSFTAPGAGALVPINQNQIVSVRWVQGSGSTPVPDGTRVNFAATRGVLSAAQATTTNGVASVTINSAQAGGSSISASSPDLTTPTASVSIQFVASEAATLSLQADPAVIATNESSTISAIVRDAGNNLVANKTVEFGLTDSTGGTLSSSTAVTSLSGIARVTYAAGSVTSADNGVRIDAVARNTNGSTASGSATLTVAARALRILLGTGNEIFAPNETTYQFPYSAIVTDSAGNPAPDASFRLSALPLKYFKGYYVAVAGQWAPVITATCDNEDTNRNGIKDPGEDLNGDGVLQPGNIAAVPSSPPLEPDGSVQFNITYPQDRGNWVQLRLSAIAAVAGTETSENAVFVVPISAPDAVVENGAPPGTGYYEGSSGIDANDDGDMLDSFVGSPYGLSSVCTDAQ